MADGALAWSAYQKVEGNFGFIPDVGGTELTLEGVIRDAEFVVNPTVSGMMLSYPRFIDKNGNPWFYNPQGGTFSVELTCPPTAWAGNDWELYVEHMSGFDTEEAEVINADTSKSGDTIIGSFGLPGWYRAIKLVARFDAIEPSTYINRIDFRTARSSAALGVGEGAWLPVIQNSPEFGNYKRIYANSRVNATSYLFQNTTAVLNKEGSIEAVRAPVSGTSFFTTSGSDALAANLATAAASERYVGLLEKGFYTFIPPDQKTSGFNDWTNGIYEDSFAYVSMVRFSDYGESATSMMLSWDFHIEFRNNSMLWDIGISSMPLEDWHRAQVALASIPYFYENFTHLATIAALARAAATRLAPIVMPVARRVGNALITSAANQAKGLATAVLSRQAMNIVTGKTVVKKQPTGKKKMQVKVKKHKK